LNRDGHDRDDGNPSRARDHLANERTYLAWLRTGANVMILGLVVAKFGPGSGYSMSSGAVLIAVGIAGLAYGTRRYRRISGEIEHGRFVTGTRGRGPALAAGVLIAAVLVALALVFLSRGGT